LQNNAGMSTFTKPLHKQYYRKPPGFVLLGMAIAAITKEGLAAIAILVAILWGCLVSERLTVQRANQEMGRVLREMHRPTPAAWPQRLTLPARPAHS